jgi:hypothetical protein
MAKDENSKAGWLDRRREKKREKQLRTGDSPEKIAEGRMRRDQTPGENADRAGWAGFLGGRLLSLHWNAVADTRTAESAADRLAY